MYEIIGVKGEIRKRIMFANTSQLKEALFELRQCLGREWEIKPERINTKA